MVHYTDRLTANILEQIKEKQFVNGVLQEHTATNVNSEGQGQMQPVLLGLQNHTTSSSISI